MKKFILLIFVILFSSGYSFVEAKDDSNPIVFERRHPNRKRIPPISTSQDSRVYALLSETCVELYVEIPEDMIQVVVTDEDENVIFEIVTSSGCTELDLPDQGIYLISVITLHNGIYEGYVGMD